MKTLVQKIKKLSLSALLKLLIFVRLGNSKLGKIWKFSMLAVETCPARSVACSGPARDGAHSDCYAFSLQRMYTNVRNLWGKATALAMTNLPALESAIRADLENIRLLPSTSRVFRIHESGDFFSLDYVQMWIRICSDYPDFKFFAYTRSWVIPTLEIALCYLDKLANVTLWASVDATMPAAPAHWRTATMLPKGVTATEGGVTCLEQTGRKPTCETCTLCWVAKPSAKLGFILH